MRFVFLSVCLSVCLSVRPSACLFILGQLLIKKWKMTESAIVLCDVSAVGCANPPGLPPGVWLRRDGNHAVLRCNTTGDTWRITCSGSEWRGQTRVNCSQSASSSSAAAFPLDGMSGWNMSQFFAHEAFPLSKVFGLPF